jgi:hypothetical protein
MLKSIPASFPNDGNLIMKTQYYSWKTILWSDKNIIIVWLFIVITSCRKLTSSVSKYSWRLSMYLRVSQWSWQKQPMVLNAWMFAPRCSCKTSWIVEYCLSNAQLPVYHLDNLVYHSWNRTYRKAAHRGEFKGLLIEPYCLWKWNEWSVYVIGGTVKTWRNVANTSVFSLHRNITGIF